ncbi:hypothetical protein F4818DRAFT_271535 [Hypoxylon cercidicola]|nr:hypothetical protein F4818DRAFT_271535 [Hypoxylon cercidicola]
MAFFVLEYTHPTPKSEQYLSRYLSSVKPKDNTTDISRYINQQFYSSKPIMTSNSEALVFAGRLLCRDHNRLTCLVCLHSINSIDGFMPTPEISRFPCPESAHSVEPRFELFKPHNISLYGLHQGLSPQQREHSNADRRIPQLVFPEEGDNRFDCESCGLTYYTEGGPGYADIHPSHVSADGKRYVTVAVEPITFGRHLDKIDCITKFWFSSQNHELNSTYVCSSRPDFGTVDWNLENAQISALVVLFEIVEDKVIPHRQKLIDDAVYTNSEYFAGQSWRFQLIVYTMLSPATLDVLLRAHKLQYSRKRKAFVERNALGLVSKKYPVTEERQRQIVYFIRMIKRLAELGIQVFWHRLDPSNTYKKARKAFMDQPSQLPKPQGKMKAQADVDLELNESQEEEEDLVESDALVEELLAGDSPEALPAHEDLDAVEQGRSLDDLDNLFHSRNDLHFG